MKNGSPHSYYDVLELQPHASLQEIKEQYHLLLHAWHPDKFPNPQQKARAQERTTQIIQAYATLQNVEKRARYDQALQSSLVEEPSVDHIWEAEPDEQTAPTHSFDGLLHLLPIPDIFQTTCQHCGITNATLRWVAFPYVLGLGLWTHYGAWSGFYCEPCRRGQMHRAKIITGLLGWWCIPRGVQNTLALLRQPNEGLIPLAVNVTYLQVLSTYFMQSGDYEEAMMAFDAKYYYAEQILTIENKIDE